MNGCNAVKSYVPVLESRLVTHNADGDVLGSPQEWKDATVEALGGTSMLPILNFAREHAPSSQYDTVQA